MSKTIRTAALLAAGALAVPAQAGNGNITPPIDGLDTSGANKISMSVNLTAPLPAEADGEDLLEMAKRQLTWANRIICDMTDDQFRIADVTFVHGEAALQNADVWWLPQSNTFHEAGGAFGELRHLQPGPNGLVQLPNPYASAGHVKIFGYEPRDSAGVVSTGFRGATLAHELAHALFRLGDQYPDQRGRFRRCPVGTSVTDGPASIDGYFRSFATRTPQSESFADTSGSETRIGRIYVFGGEGNTADPNGIFHEAEVYDPATDSWESLPDMQVPRHGFGAAVIGNRMYLPGGSTSQGIDAQATHSVFYLEAP